MEFKVFKNENSKILKEYWLTQSEWDALDKTTVQEGDIYHIVGTIDKGDLSADVNASLAKGDSSLQKPTATLAKESFVKVGIDGTQKFDESSYVVAPSTDGTAGQVLKKTATGTEWADESGGGSSVTVVQGLGYSTTAVMSQKAVTNIYDELRYAPNATKLLYNGDFSKTLPTAISCRFYWGDGTFTDYTNAVDISHTYSDQASLHTISIVGLTSIPDSMFVDDTELYEIIFGVGVSADMICFANCPNLKTIRIQDHDENVLPITTNDMSVFTYNFDYVNFRVVVPRRLYVKILENNTNISTEFIWNFVVPDDSYVCSHSIQLSGSNNSTYEVMLYSTCKLPLNQVPLATDPSTGTDKKRDLLRELIDGEIAYKYSGDSMDGFGSLIYSDSDNQYHLAFCGGFGGTKIDETFDLTEIISDIVKLK